MKFVTTAIALLLACSALAQDGSGPAIRNMNGRGTNTTSINATNGGTTTFPSGSSVTSGGVFTGNAGGLTNVQSISGTGALSSFTFRTNATERIYSVKAFGAVGDGKYINNCYATNGSVVVFSSDGGFVASDAGKVFSIAFAGSNGAQAWTSSISNVISSFRVALSNAPINTTNSVPAVYGTDDTAAIQRGLDVVCTNGGGTLLFPNDSTNPGTIYIVNGPVRDVGSWTNHMNAQIYAPSNGITAGGQKSPVVMLRGPIPQVGGNVAGVNNPFIWKAYGSTIFSTLPFGPNGNDKASMFQFKGHQGTVTNVNPLIYFYPFNYLTVGFENLAIKGCYNGNLTLVNLAGTPAGGVEGCSIDQGFDQVAQTAVAFPTATNSIGVALPQYFNDNRVWLKNTMVSYFYDGVMMGENAQVEGTYVFCVGRSAFNFINAGGNLSRFDNCTLAGVTNVFYNLGGISDIWALINVQNSFGGSTNWNLAFHPLGSFKGTIYVYDTGALEYQTTNGMRVVGPVAGYLDIIPTFTAIGPSHQSSQLFRTNIDVYGISTFKNPLRFGSDVNSGNTIFTNRTTANTRKHTPFMFARYADSASTTASFMGVTGQNANDNTLSLGFNAVGGTSTRGMNTVTIELSASDAAQPSRRWDFQGDGQFKPYPTHAALVGQPGGGYGTIGRLWTTNLTVGGGMTPDAGGFKHARITTGSIGAGSTAPITNTWVTAFADANYTVSASVVDSTASSLSLSVVHIDSVTTTNVVVRVLNNAVGSLTGVLHLIAIHD
jgi:hypothetical protein